MLTLSFPVEVLIKEAAEALRAPIDRLNAVNNDVLIIETNKFFKVPPGTLPINGDHEYTSILFYSNASCNRCFYLFAGLRCWWPRS